MCIFSSKFFFSDPGFLYQSYAIKSWTVRQCFVPPSHQFHHVKKFGNALWIQCFCLFQIVHVQWFHETICSISTPHLVYPVHILWASYIVHRFSRSQVFFGHSSKFDSRSTRPPVVEPMKKAQGQRTLLIFFRKKVQRYRYRAVLLGSLQAQTVFILASLQMYLWFHLRLVRSAGNASIVLHGVS